MAKIVHINALLTPLFTYLLTIYHRGHLNTSKVIVDAPLAMPDFTTVMINHENENDREKNEAALEEGADSG